MKKNELYIAPEVEVINVMVEKGFALSNVPGVDDPLNPDTPEDF